MARHRPLSLVFLASVFALGCQPVTEGNPTDDDASSTDTSTAETTDSAETNCVDGEQFCPCGPNGECSGSLVCIDGICELGPDDTDTTETTGGCTAEGCDCVPGPDACDPGLVCVDGTCILDSCGNEALDQGEECDDGNDVDGDGCDNDCSFTQILQIAAGGAHTCALIEGGRLRCWGQNSFGQLGYGHANNIGDTETPASAGDVTLPGPVEAIALGGFHTCGLFADGELRCWGQSNYGQLGYGDGANNLGDDESLADLAPVELGANPATVLATSENHSCALLDNGKIRCWGQVLNGRLGLGMLLPQYGNYIGDDETPADAPQVFLGPDAKAIRAGRAHTCAITVGDQVRCWGVAASGRLGYGNQTVIGDDESPSDAGDVAVYPDGFMGTVSALALGDGHSCALYSNGEVRCWGEANEGQLGQGKKDDWGDGANEAPGDLPAISLGESAVAISAGNLFSCALLSTGEVRCWGDSTKGQLGLGDTEKIGDDAGELPDTVPVVDLGGTAIMIASGQEHSCVVLDDYRVLCWGANTDGRLGYGNQQTIGDTESPSEAGAIELF